MKKLLNVLSVMAVSLVFGGGYMSVANADGGLQKVAMQVPQIQTPINPLLTKSDYLVRTKRNGKRKYCRHRHCDYWHHTYHRGHHRRHCDRWHYTSCYWRHPHRRHHYHGHHGGIHLDLHF